MDLMTVHGLTVEERFWSKVDHQGASKGGGMTGKLTAAIALCDEIVGERWRQLAKFGPQSWPDGTGGWAVSAAIAKLNCDRAAEDGSLTWRHILEEEFYEALDEKEWPKLRTELLQIAAVCLAWVEDGDQRQLAAKAEQPEAA